MDNRYDIGDIANPQATFKVDGTNTDPSALQVRVLSPSGIESIYVYGVDAEVGRSGVGIYFVEIPVDETGLWWYAWEATGAVAVVAEDSFYAGQRFSLGGLVADYALISLAEAREFVYNDPTDDRADERLQARINEYSLAVNRYTSHEWLPTADDATRRIWYDGRGFLSLAPFDARSITSITLYANYPTASQLLLANGSSSVTAEWFGHADPNLGVIQWLDLPLSSSCEVAVLADWGVGLVPDDVKLAVKIAVRNAIENPTGYQTRGYGETQVIEAGAFEEAGRAGGNLPPEARALLAPYRRGFVFVA